MGMDRANDMMPEPLSSRYKPLSAGCKPTGSAWREVVSTHAGSSHPTQRREGEQQIKDASWLYEQADSLDTIGNRLGMLAHVVK